MSLALAVPADGLAAGPRTSRNDTSLLPAGCLVLPLPLLFFGTRLVTSPLRLPAEEAGRGAGSIFPPGRASAPWSPE